MHANSKFVVIYNQHFCKGIYGMTFLLMAVRIAVFKDVFVLLVSQHLVNAL